MILTTDIACPEPGEGQLLLRVKAAGAGNGGPLRHQSGVLCGGGHNRSVRPLRELFDSAQLIPHLGMVLALEQARTADEMLAGAAHKPRKIVLKVAS